MIRWTSRYLSIWLRASLLGVLVIFGYLCFYSGNNYGRPLSFRPGNLSAGNPGPGANIVVSVKTGASEAAERIPNQMQTSLRDVQNVVFFSDLEQDIGQYHLYDSLDTIKPSVMENNPDFIFYHKQRELWNTSHDISSLKHEKHPEGSSDLAAWTLDKYKNIHILEKTWALMPNHDWYIFIDADTYLLWPNMVSWLSILNPKKKSYFGSEVNAGGVKFAHGGTGIIISKAAMYNLAVRHAGMAASYDSLIHSKCCGDLVLGMALEKSGTSLQDVWPAMSGETPWTMPFGKGTPEYWCKPALTLHHVSPDGMAELAAFEDRRENKSRPLTHEEMFNTLVLKSLVSERENWDNLASEKGEFGNTGGVTSETPTFEDCARACEADEKCFQYSHHARTCNIGMSVRLGYKKEADSEGIWRSGWNLTRLHDWAARQPKCGTAEFPKQNI